MASINNEMNVFTCNMTAFQLKELAKQVRREEHKHIIRFIEEHPDCTIDDVSFGTGIEHDSVMGMLNTETSYWGISYEAYKQKKQILKDKKRISRKFREIDSNGNLLDNTIEITNTKAIYKIGKL